MTAVVLGLVPPIPGIGGAVSDKLVHFVEFFVLMIWFGGLYTGRAQWLAAAGLVLLGVMIELFQAANIFRTFDTGDIVANLAGLVTGLLLVRTWLRGWCGRIEAMLA